MDWLAILDKYGYPTLLLALGTWFFYRKIWPLMEKFVIGILDATTQQTEILKQIWNRLEDQDRSTAQHIHDTERIADMIREKK